MVAGRAGKAAMIYIHTVGLPPMCPECTVRQECMLLSSSFQVWITAEKQDVIAGVYFWPGSAVEIEGLRPHYYHKYNL